MTAGSHRLAGKGWPWIGGAFARNTLACRLLWEHMNAAKHREHEGKVGRSGSNEQQINERERDREREREKG